jgi:hypothetical protein
MERRGMAQRGGGSNAIDSGAKGINVARGLKKGRAFGQSHHQTSISIIVYLILAKQLTKWNIGQPL